MRPQTVLTTLGFLLPLTKGSSLNPRILNDPTARYLTEMCYPIYSNRSRISDLNLSINERLVSLINSPYPCEQSTYLQSACTANGTTPADFLAEQQCLCNGSYFQAMEGCFNCYSVHGGITVPATQAFAEMTALSVGECSPSPPFQPYSNLLTTANITSYRLAPPFTLGNDQFPNDTAVSNYWTSSAPVSAGEITGAATARQTSWTNYSGVRFRPTSTPVDFVSATAAAAGSVTGQATTQGGSGTGGSSSVSGSGASTTSPNAARATEVRAAGGILAVALGVVALL